MKYSNISTALFVERKNRFVAVCNAEGKEISVHVPNTGRCRELFIPGAKVYIQKAENAVERKTEGSLIAVEKNGVLFNVDSRAPNVIFGEAVGNGSIKIPGIGDVKKIKAESVFEDSRLDFFISATKGEAYAEVKGVTLETNGIAKFPDAPTERGVKHLKTLMRAVDKGYKALAVFVLQFSGACTFMPNAETHSEFARALKQAKGHGVEIIAFECDVKPDEITYKKLVNVEI